MTGENAQVHEIPNVRVELEFSNFTSAFPTLAEQYYQHHYMHFTRYQNLLCIKMNSVKLTLNSAFVNCQKSELKGVWHFSHGVCITCKQRPVFRLRHDNLRHL